MPGRLGGDVEPVCAAVLVEVSRRFESLRSVIERLRPRVPRGLLNAVCLGVLRNYKLLERGLHVCGVERPPRRDRRGWLLLVGAYEAMMRPSVPLERVAAKTGLPEEAARCLRRLSPEEAVEGIRDPLRRLAVLYSVPRWVVEELARLEPPGGLEALLRGLQEPTPVWLRLNTARAPREELLRKLAEAGVEAEPDPLLPDMARIVRAEPGALERIDKSLAYPMDRAPAAAVHMLAASLEKPCRLAADLFSAPGNKAAHLHWLTGCPSVSVELSWRRLLTEKRLHGSQGLRIASYVAGDATAPPLRHSAFDAVIVDPDCTSMGRLGHSPETRLFLEAAGRALLRRLQELQLAGLRAAARLARRGARILYTTCTLTLQENEEVTTRIAEEEGLEPLETRLPLGVEGGVRGSRRFYPHLTRSTGGYAVVLSKP